MTYETSTHPVRVISRRSLFEREIEIVDNEVLCRQLSRKNAENPPKESWDEDGFLYTREGETIWVSLAGIVRFVANRPPGRFYTTLASRPILVLQ
jgi:hypothetical protein